MTAVKAITNGRILNSLKTSPWQGILNPKYKISQYPTLQYEHEQSKRFFQTSNYNRDIEVAFKSLGAGVAVTGVIGPGIGVGIVFGNLLNAVARNPSVSDRLFQNAIMGAAFCEGLGLFSVIVAFMVLFT